MKRYKNIQEINKYEKQHEIFLAILQSLPNFDGTEFIPEFNGKVYGNLVDTGELHRLAWDLYYKATRTKPEGDICSFCGRDNYVVDKEGYGPCGCK